MKGFARFCHNNAERAEKEIMKNSEDRIAVRKYLLGNLRDEVRMRQIEEQTLLEDDFLEKLSIAEDELLDDYLDGTLTGDEQERFTEFFLNSPERKQKLRLLENLRRYAKKSHAPVVKKIAREKFRFYDWRGLFSSAALRFALVVLVLIGIGFGVWRVGFYQSDADRGLAQLRAAYRGKRPSESRTTANFDYAPLSETRGNAASADEKARSRAERLLLDATENSADSKARHALGLFYLTEKKFDAAFDEFNAALKLAPDDAKLYSDTGAAFLEKAGQTEREAQSGESLENLALALKSVNRALEIDDSLREAFFNRALILQKMRLTNQAREAWEKYLEKDSVSPWAEEARKNLERLKNQIAAAKDKSQILRDFLDCYRNKDDPRAWEIASQTKELITGAMVAPQLARKFLVADEQSRKDEAAEILSAFAYLGELEKHHANDDFFAEIAGYYSKTNQMQRQKLLRANAAMQEGYGRILNADWQSSLRTFQTARDIFFDAGDVWEAAVAEYQICYCLCQLKQIKESSERLRAVADWSEQRNYRWLQSLADGWSGNNYSLLGEHSKAIGYGQKSLETARAISDVHNAQKVFNQLAEQYRIIGDEPRALTNVYRGLNFSNLYFLSSRQKSRNLLVAAAGLYRFKFYDAAAVFAQEEVRVARDELADAWLSHTAHNQTALIYGADGKYAEAFREIEASFRFADSFSNEAMREKQNTKTRLTLAHLQRESKNCAEAIGNYDRVIGDYENTEFSINKYEARKGRLLCLTTLGDDAAVKEEMPEILKMFDENRQTIADEASRNTFFDNEQDVYDVAVGYSRNPLRDDAQAFYYAENSRARSLLGAIDNVPAQPLALAEIRSRMSADAQIVYYAVLPDKLLIWQISDHKFVTAEKTIDANELSDKIADYTKLLLDKNADKTAAKDLYQLLIEPLEATLEANKTLCIVADKSLFHVPFAALVSPATNKYLIEDYALVYAPSATVFVGETEIARKKADRRRETILSVGNPAFSPKDYPQLADLSDAAREAKEVAAFYDSPKIYLGSQAEKRQISGNLDEADVVHFAGHYVPNKNSPALSKLVLAAGDLTVEEVMRRKLPRTRLIILSACETGVEGFYRGEGMFGAARAFLAADVPLIVASQWAVDSASAAALMIKLHAYRKQEGMATINALRRAQVDMLTDDNPQFRQPYYWAGFLALGGYAEY